MARSHCFVNEHQQMWEQLIKEMCLLHPHPTSILLLKESHLKTDLEPLYEYIGQVGAKDPAASRGVPPFFVFDCFLLRTVFFVLEYICVVIILLPHCGNRKYEWLSFFVYEQKSIITILALLSSICFFFRILFYNDVIFYLFTYWQNSLYFLIPFLNNNKKHVYDIDHKKSLVQRVLSNNFLKHRGHSIDAIPTLCLCVLFSLSLYFFILSSVSVQYPNTNV